MTQTRLEQSRSLLAAAEANASRDNSGDFEGWRSAWQDWVRQLQDDSGYTLGETRLGSRHWMTLWNSQPRYDWAGPWSVPMFDHDVVHGHLLGQSTHFSVYYDGLTWFPLARQVGVVGLILLCVLAAPSEKMALYWKLIVQRNARLVVPPFPSLTGMVTVYGPPDLVDRTPTVSWTVAGHEPDAIATHLAQRQVAVWSGNYYAVETMAALGLRTGAVRAGVSGYTSEVDVTRLLDAVGELAR